MHSVEASRVPDHCRVYALSDPNNADFEGTCDHAHDESCPQCSQLENVLSTLESGCSDVQSSEECKADLLHALKQAKENIMSWKAHQLRSVHQTEAKHSVLEKLDSRSVLLVQDWAMKYMPRRYREAQSDWFAKRGLPWHITVAITKSEVTLHFESQTIVHVFQSCPQDSATVASIMRDCLVSLKKEIPELERAYFKQDNAGCYHSGNSVVSAKLAGDAAGVPVIRNDFSDPQGGKGVCDRQAATIKGDIGRYVNEGNDVMNGEQLKTAIESGQGTTGVKASYVAAKTSRTTSVKWDGISLLNNFQYEESGVRAWRAFNVGPGKLFPWATFDGAAQLPEPLQVLDPSSQSVSGKPTFRTVRHRYVKKTSADSSAESLSEDSVTEQEEPMLFPCPEEGCVKAYSHFTYLQAHLDTGRHEMVLEQETLYDKAMKLYACKLTEGHVRIPSLESNMQTGDGSSPLKKGWALKTIKKRARFSDKQRQYLTEQFQKGEESGRKCDPQEVSKSMGLERDQGGARIFHPDEVLTAQQITSFFGRLAAKKQLLETTPTESDNDGNDSAAEVEAHHSTLCTNVMQDVSLQHPVVSSAFNVCELVRRDKLKSLSVDELKGICISLEIDISDVSSKKRKKPFVQLLVDLVGECSCAKSEC